MVGAESGPIAVTRKRPVQLEPSAHEGLGPLVEDHDDDGDGEFEPAHRLAQAGSDAASASTHRGQRPGVSAA